VREAPSPGGTGVRLWDVSATIGTRAIAIALGLAGAVLTARLLGPAGRGTYFTALSVTALTTQLATLGLHSSNTWLVARGRSATVLLSNSLWLSAVGGGGTVLLVGMGALAFGGIPGLGWVDTLIALFAVLPAHFYLLASALLMGQGRISTYNRFELAARSFPLSLMFLASLWPSTMTFLLASAVGSYAVAILVFSHMSPGPLRRFQRGTFLEGVSYGARAHAASLLSLAVVRVQPLLLALRADAAEVGFFSVASQVADALVLLPATFSLVLFPVLTRHPSGRVRETLRALAITCIAMAVACGAVAILAEPLLPRIFGEAYRPATQVLLYWLPGVFCLGLTSVLSQYLAAVGLPWPLVALWGVALASATVLCAILAPQRGAAGSAIAMSVTYAGLLCGVTILALCWPRSRAAA